MKLYLQVKGGAILVDMSVTITAHGTEPIFDKDRNFMEQVPTNTGPRSAARYRNQFSR